jgi:hypothetical protein
MIRLKRIFRTAFIVLLAATAGLAVLFIVTYNKCVTVTIRNESSLEARDVRIHVKNDEVLFFPYLAPTEEKNGKCLRESSAIWSIQYKLAGALASTQSPLNDVYVDSPGEVHIEIAITPDGPMASRK